MKKIGGIRKSDETNIDLTPMLDVVFILLIFFVVTATFLSETVINAASNDNTDQPPPPEDDEKKNILVQLGANNAITFNGNPRPVIATQIRASIEVLKAENPEASVIIQPDNDSNVATLVAVMDAARESGISSIMIIEP